MKILGVGSTTIKRWASENKLPCIRTKGGHRRFNLMDVENLLGNQSAPTQQDLLSTTTWVNWLTGKNDVVYIRDGIVRLHDHLGDWFKVADFLGRVTREIGDAWFNNEITILEEHIATGQLELALSAISTSIRIPDSAPVCLLATLTGEQHTVGLSLARLCIRSYDFLTLWAGANTPADELVAEIENSKPKLLALSASSWSTDSGSLAKAYLAIELTCKKNGTELIIGGAGAWPDISNDGHRCQSFKDLSMVLKNLKITPTQS